MLDVLHPPWSPIRYEILGFVKQICCAHDGNPKDTDRVAPHSVEIDPFRPDRCRSSVSKSKRRVGVPSQATSQQFGPLEERYSMAQTHRRLEFGMWNGKTEWICYKTHEDTMVDLFLSIGHVRPTTNPLDASPPEEGKR